MKREVWKKTNLLQARTPAADGYASADLGTAGSDFKPPPKAMAFPPPYSPILDMPSATSLSSLCLNIFIQTVTYER